MTRWHLYALLLFSTACSAHAPLPNSDSTQAKTGPAKSVSAAPSRAPATSPVNLDSAAPVMDDMLGVARGRQGAVSVAEGYAAEVGLQVLKDGGNAVDAAVAIAFALAVTHPTAGNLGGGGFMLIRTAAGEINSIDYREVAPAAARANMYLNGSGTPTKESLIGPKAAGIPGTVAGLTLAHKKYGSLPFARLLAPAIRLAEQGHAIDALHAKSLDNACKRMEAVGQASSARYYRSSNGQALQAGDTWRQPDLAWSLRQIAEPNSNSFYQGVLAERLTRGVRSLGGIWSAKDLANYKAKERAPLSFDYQGHRIHAMPLPSAGGIVLRQILTGQEVLGAHNLAYGSPQAMHLFAEVARRAYADRNMLLGDPDFVSVPVDRLTALPYIEQRVANVDPNRATPSSEINPGLTPTNKRESHDTTHFSVVDRHGNAVSNTYTLNTRFGAKVVVPGTGILLNNEMDDFAAAPGKTNGYGLVQGIENGIEPGKRMLSSMTPTIIEKDGKLRAVLGSPGGPTITNTVALIASAIIDHDMSLVKAVHAPRLHHQWLPDRILVEPNFDPKTIEHLRSIGHEVLESPYGPIGHANCIEARNGDLWAVADAYRGKGGAARAF